MNSQNMLFDSVTQAFSAAPTILWVVLIAALVVPFFLKIIARSFLPNFTSKPLLNKSEIRLFKILQQETPEHFSLFTQVSYGEFLRCANNKKFWTINAKRADFVICCKSFNVVAAIEYQGSGHYGSTGKSRQNSENRDRVKRKALAEANIQMVEIFHKYDRDSVRQSLDPIFNPPDTDSQNGRAAKFNSRYLKDIP